MTLRALWAAPDLFDADAYADYIAPKPMREDCQSSIYRGTGSRTLFFDEVHMNKAKNRMVARAMAAAIHPGRRVPLRIAVHWIDTLLVGAVTGGQHDGWGWNLGQA